MEAPAKVECPHCHHSNAPGTVRCASCDSVFVDSDATLAGNATVMSDATQLTNAAVATNWSRNTGSQGTFDSPAMSLEEGSLLAERYEIIKLLGQGGMGAVYKAKDRELDRFVALKVIRPELAGHPSILQRFKQELLLARKITHRNIIRIYDLGVAEGLRFITMEFVEGQDLSTLLDERHKFTPEETVKILRQVCSALEAAHAEGVVHRDLKPQNIMIGEGGRICVMDFGLARSMEAGGLTQAGAVMGTPAYMSPEQAKGLPADERSDLFSLGIIAYLMLTGEIPFKADSALASMLLRTQGPPTPSIQLEPTIPQALNDVVQKALAVDPKDRYQSATQMGQDLYDWQEGTLAKAIVTPRVVMMAESHTKRWIALALAGAAIVAAGGYGLDRWLHRTRAPVAPMTVMIADFNNHTGDPVFSGTLESTLKLALEGASFINAYDRTRVRDLGLKAISGTLDDSKAQEIAASQGLNVVVSGSIDRRGADYQLSLRATQTVTGKSITSADATASSKDQVLFAVTKLGTTVRKALGDETSDSAQRFSMETLTAASLEAVHEYATALDDLSSGKTEDALKHFSQAVDLDSNFGLAYAGMAAASHNLSRQQDAEKYIKLALNHIDHMTERERYRTRAFLYFVTGDAQKCVDEYGTLLQQYPSDTGAYNNMAYCLTRLRNMPKAIDQVRRAVTILPKRALYHANVALYSAYGGDFQTSAKEAAATLQLSPALAAFGFEAQAFASLGQGELDQSAKAYQKIGTINPSMAAAALADLAVYQGRYSEAVKILEKGVAEDTAARNPDEAADKFSALAYVQVLRGQKSAALAAAKNALDLSSAVKTRFLAARDYVALGEADKAKELSAGLSSQLQLEPQAYGKLIEGEIALKNGDGRAAVQSFTEAKNILDTWIGRFDLGTAYLELGAFTEADSEFDRCIKRRGEALALFLDEVPTYGYFPPVYYYQGRVREGLKNSGFAESYQKYLSIRGQAGEDPLLADVRRRIRQ
ncbi:MAG: protein kinase [Bryobacteraceae bacterium]|jgi:tetratricopeptide (TPR) repeat protein/predicted Ser/Thr protein kinase